MEQKNKRSGGIPWPWNLVLSIVFVVGAGYFIGYLWSFLLAMGFMAWQRKQNPGMPEGGYCLEKTRKNLSSLGVAVIVLFFGVCVAVYVWVQLQEDTSTWETMEYIKLAVGGLGGLALLLCGIYTAYTSVRDAFWPEKSTLARSIRSQLTYPDGAPDVKELFAMVDRDIEENGQWFDKVAVGKEWVLGEVASYIPRIRVFFGRDEIRTRRNGSHVNSTRILELHILDDRRQHQIMTLRSPSELQALLDCIALRAPDALRRPYSEYGVWQGKSDMEWENMLREYRVKHGEREMAEFQLGNTDNNLSQSMTLTFPDGSVTSRVTPELIHQTLMDCLRQCEGTFLLTPGTPKEENGVRFLSLECFASFYEDIENPTPADYEELGEAELLLNMTSPGGGDLRYGRVYNTDIRTAVKILRAWLKGEIPNLKDWEATPIFAEGQKESVHQELRPPHLGLMSAAGVFQSHDRFTEEDVQAAAVGIVDGTYQMVDLTLTGGYLWMRIQSGNKMDGRCTVSVTRADSDKLRFFKIQCTHRQAAAWLLEFINGTFYPNWKEWKDYTKQAEWEMNHKK